MDLYALRKEYHIKYAIFNVLLFVALGILLPLNSTLDVQNYSSYFKFVFFYSIFIIIYIVQHVFKWRMKKIEKIYRNERKNGNEVYLGRAGIVFDFFVTLYLIELPFASLTLYAFIDTWHLS